MNVPLGTFLAFALARRAGRQPARLGLIPGEAVSAFVKEI